MKIQSVTLPLLFSFFFLFQPGEKMTFGQDTKDENSIEVVLPKLGDKLTDAQVTSFAKLALKNIHTEYPNKPSNVVWDADSVRTPKKMHPAFFGCFDWHSSCLLYTSPSPRDATLSRMPSSA